MNKAFWNHFKHFERLLGKIYLLLTPCKTDGRVPSRQGIPTTKSYNQQPDLLGSFPADVRPGQELLVQTLLASWGVRCNHSAKFSPSVGVGGVAILHTKSQKTTWIIFFPATLSFQGYIYFSKSPSQQKLPEEQIFWGTDPLAAPVIG